VNFTEAQVDFTEALRTATYILRVQKQAEKVKSISQKSTSIYLLFYILHSYVQFIVSKFFLNLEYFLTA